MQWRIGDRSVCGLVAWLVLTGSAADLRAQVNSAPNWAQFRGSNGDGIVADQTLPTEWGPDQNVIWKSRLPGIGWSQPIVWGDKIFLTTAQSNDQSRPDVNNRGPGVGMLDLALGRASRQQPPDVVYHWQVICLDGNTGAILWQQNAREGRPTLHIHQNNTYASETPVTDGQRLIAYFGMTGIYCYDVSGTSLWTRELGTFPMQYGWGTGSSPVMFDNLVYVQCDNEQSSFLVALDAATGEEAWRVDREEKSNWSTPYIWRNKLRTELVAAGGTRMRSYDPKSGELLWSMKGSGRTSTTPVGNDELLIVDSYDRMTGRTGTLVAMRPGATGDVTIDPQDGRSEHLAWTAKLSGCRVASPLIYDGKIYVLEQLSGVVRCLDAATGMELGRKRLPAATGFTASPMANDGKLFFFDQSGTTFVLASGTELKPLAENKLDAMCWASPAVIQGRLLIRSVDDLYCIGK